MRVDKMKKNVFAISAIGMLLLSSFAFAPVITGAPLQQPSDGDILYVGGSGSGNYTYIQDAVDNASNGDTVFVYKDSSPYYENVIVNKTIDLIGENTMDTIIVGSGFGNAVEITANNVNMSNFTVQQSPVTDSLKYFEEEELYYAPNVIEKYATRFTSDGQCKLTTCSLSFYQPGSVVTTDDGINITVWDDDGNGYPGTQRANINLPASEVKWYPEWIEVDFSSLDLTFTDDFHVGFGTVNLTYDYYAILFDNMTYAPDLNRSSYLWDGIWYLEDYGDYLFNYLIIANVTSSGGIGINLTNSDNSIIKMNVITQCENGVLVNGICNDNKIYHNNLIDNTQNAYDAGSNTWDNGTEGNYWDDYTGEDGDDDGIGDTPYNISGGDNQDLYPLMEPWSKESVEITISIDDPQPEDNAVNVSINQSTVSVYISATLKIKTNHGYAELEIPFAWKIDGDNVSKNSSESDTKGRKEAPIIGPLENNSEYVWNVSVLAAGVWRDEIFRFTTPDYNEPPVANFTYVINNLDVSFDSSISDDPDGYLTNWTWDFGDGDSSYEEHPQHTYAAYGTYDVTLTVRDNDSATNSITKSVSVSNDPPIANFTYFINDLTVTFDATNSSDPDGTIENYTWDFGDGNSSYGQVIEHTYGKEKVYTVVLTVTDDGGLTDRILKDINLTNIPPIANFTYAVEGKTVNFDATSSYDENGTIDNYFWGFGDGTNYTSAKPLAEHTYNQDYQTYNVTLTVTDGAGLTSNLSKDIFIDDATKPTFKIDKPIKALYINDVYKIQRIRMPLIIGDITIAVNATDENGSGIKQVNFYIDAFRPFASQEGNATEPNDDDLYNWTWKKNVIFRFLHIHIIKVEVIDNAGNIATKTMLVRRFL